VSLPALVRHAPVAADQALSSASNFLLALLVARSVSAADFGHFAVATSVYWMALGGLRALVAEPLLILREHAVSETRLSAAVGLGVSIALGGSVAGAVVLVAGGPGTVGWLLVCLPVLIWQDLARYCAFSLKRPLEALLSDGLWLALLLATGVALLATGHRPSVSGWLVLWAACALVPAVVTAARTGAWPARAGQRAWWARSRRQAGPMLGDFAVYTVRDSLFVFLLPVVTTFALLGQVKAAMVATGPLSVLMTAAGIAALPELARRWASSSRVPARAGFLVGAGMATVAGCYGLALLALPPAWGQWLFGESWVGVGVLPALLAFQSAVLCLGQGAILTLLAIGSPGWLLRARLALLPLTLLVPLLAARFGGLTVLGVSSIGIALVTGAVMWALLLRLARRTPDPVAAG